MQHFKQVKDLSIKDLMVENVEEEDPNMAVNLLTVASTGNAAFLEELLRAGLDPDIGDSKGKTPLVCSYLWFKEHVYISLNQIKKLYILKLILNLWSRSHRYIYKATDLFTK